MATRTGSRPSRLSCTAAERENDAEAATGVDAEGKPAIAEGLRAATAEPTVEAQRTAAELARRTPAAEDSELDAATTETAADPDSHPP